MSCEKFRQFRPDNLNMNISQKNTMMEIPLPMLRKINAGKI